MLIPPAAIRERWGLRPLTILHVGGHHAEELEDYEAEGWGRDGVIWVEAMPASISVIEERIASLPHHGVIQAVAWHRTGDTITFSEASNGQSSSALPLKTHADRYPDIVIEETTDMTTTALADVVPAGRFPRIGLLNLDIQGAELHALRGLGHRIDDVDAVYSEVNTEELYDGCALLPELDRWLTSRGFHRVELVMTGEGWGDGLWVRARALPRTWRVMLARRRASRWLMLQRNKARDLRGAPPLG